MDINDIRTQKEFQGKSFSKFKKNEVVKELISCILKNKIESACNWCAELICAGHWVTIWDTILLIISKYTSNPKLPIYILMRYEQFKTTLINGYIDNELCLRNNINIRILFAEIITVLCLSNKKPGLEAIKIKTDEFGTTQLTNKFKAPNINYAYLVFRENDPKEIFIAINELIYQIENKTNLLECCYWVEWIIEFDKICKKNKSELFAEPRDFSPNKFQKDIIWIIWEILLKKCSSDIETKCIQSLCDLFSIKYSYAMKKKRRLLIYSALNIILNKPNYNIDIINNNHKQIIETVTKNIDKIYKSIKKNEIAPKTDYLFKDCQSTKSNLEKTVEKLDIMKKFM